ncbi:NUDIX domain-containing protein [Kineosporia succinea]|uniref:8-oxo-dGTP pyrophosphatase MutT (NUDIX family) n=1 Tax=Kineosporia succinea TaxID=84632 RepID=A0ABT9PB82_9ACTN|nr:NUDIX domain-containing protein [Kineosporia succinea]MDP9829961.1 8-oxo-dGTP pyrophosphatase MutT (NUDIX family) [Kineosporia succinea]
MNPTKTPATVKAEITTLVANLDPHDNLAADHRHTTLDWLAHTDDIYRRTKPRTPDPHLVSYFLLVERDQHARITHVLLCEHRLAHLWLPTGGHVEPGEHPYDTVRRETHEELGTPAHPDPHHGRHPFLLTVTPTRDTPERTHTDITLWFALAGNRTQPLTPDPREFTQVRWWTPAEIRHADPARFDPHLGRALDALAAE